MKNWVVLGLAVAALVGAGCGGDGDNGGGGGGGGTVEASVNTALFYSGPIPKPGYLDITYNTGQGRGRGGLGPTANLKRVVLEDNAYGTGDARNTVRTLLNPERVLGLDLYTSQSVPLNAPMDGFSINLNNRRFEEFALEIESVFFNGSSYNGSFGSSLFNEIFPFSATLLPGRTTSVQIFLNDAMFEEDGFGGLNFLRSEFEDQNLNPDSLALEAHLADYLAFDISNVPYAPLMTTSTQSTTLYMSGDAYGLSDTPQIGDTEFEVLVPETPDPGSVLGICNLAPSFPPNSPNTYNLKVIDPRNLQNNSFITSLQGTWKWWHDPDNASQSPILNPGDFVFITFPQSTDISTQDCVLLGLSGGVIVDCYFGEVDLSSNTFNAWPISEIVKGTTNDEIVGSIGNYVYRSGTGITTVRDIRSGDFSVTGGSAPATFPATGKFIVYRL